MHKYRVGTFLITNTDYGARFAVITEQLELDKNRNKRYYLGWTDNLKEYVYFENEIDNMFIEV